MSLKTQVLKTIDVVISRQKWLNGTYIDEQSDLKNYLMSSLYDKKCDRLCCIGFVALKDGFTKEQISGISSPEDLVQKFPTKIKKKDSLIQRLIKTEKKNVSNNNICNSLLGANDDKYKMEDGSTEVVLINMTDREEQIKKIGQEIGINFIFED